MKIMKIAISYLSSIYSSVETIRKINETNADFLHVDLMDGLFVENNNFEIEALISLLSQNKLPLDIHLMTYEPYRYLDYFLPLKPAYVTFHYEAVKDVEKMIMMVKERGFKVGLAIKPETKVDNLIPFIEKIDLVLVMSVEPGSGGQSFLHSSLKKIGELKKIKEKNKSKFLINVDGGVNEKTIDNIRKVHPDIVVSGSFICKASNYQQQLDILKKIKT